MASQWYCKLGGLELGPVPFSDLVELVRAGKVADNTQVRRDGENHWQEAREVVGLLRAARATEAGAPSAAAPAAATATATKREPPKPAARPAAPAPQRERPSRVEDPSDERSSKSRLFVWGGGFLLILTSAVIAGWWSNRDTTFPHPHLSGPPTGENVLSAIRAAPPAAPSVPDLPVRTAVPVPGLEDVRAAFSPCLSGDLKTLIFAGTGNPGTGYDLYIATRAETSEPFDKPQLIEACASKETDAYPTLSPDGRELIFARSDKQPQILRSTRKSTAEEFGEPAPLSLPIDGDDGLRLERPQFLGELRLTLGLTNPKSNARKVQLFGRSGTDAPFESRGDIRLSNAWPPYFFSESDLRAYYGGPRGLFIAARKAPKDPIAGEVLIGDAKVTGPVDGPIWVAPQEDLIVYCSAGPGRKPGSKRQLWMWQF